MKSMKSMKLPSISQLKVGHSTVERWLKSDEVKASISSTGFKGLNPGDSARLTRDVQSGVYCLNAGETVTLCEFDPNPNICWVTGNQLIGIMVDVPIDALEKFTRLNER